MLLLLITLFTSPFIAASNSNCLVLSTSNRFGRATGGSCFTHSLDSLNCIIIHESNKSVVGISFVQTNGLNMSFMENSYTNSYTVDLMNSFISGIDIWIGSYGVYGLQFQLFDQTSNIHNRTPVIGNTDGCHSYMNSSFIKSNYFKINLISGCIDNQNSTSFPSLTFEYSFSQCPFLNSNLQLTQTTKQLFSSTPSLTPNFPSTSPINLSISAFPLTSSLISSIASTSTNRIIALSTTYNSSSASQMSFSIFITTNTPYPSTSFIVTTSSSTAIFNSSLSTTIKLTSLISSLNNVQQTLAPTFLSTSFIQISPSSNISSTIIISTAKSNSTAIISSYSTSTKLPLTIFYDNLCISKNYSFISVFQSPTLFKTVKYYGVNHITSAISFGAVCDSNISYFVLVDSQSVIAKYDQHWNYTKELSIKSPRFMLTLNDGNTKRLFISQYKALTEIDKNLTVIKTINTSSNNEGLYFNTTSSLLLVSSSSSPVINVYNLNLTLIRNITVPNPNNYIVEYNGLLYVSSTGSDIMVLHNEIFKSSISTVCSDITALAIDQFGIIAISCFSGSVCYIYLYSAKTTTFTGQSWQSPLIYVTNIGFDGIGNLIISTYYGLHFFTKSTITIQTPSNNNYSHTLCDFCILKDLNLTSVFKNYQITQSVTYFSAKYFVIASSVSIFCDHTSNMSFTYALDIYYNYGVIYQFDNNWNLLKEYYLLFPYYMVAVNNSIEINIFVTTRFGIYSLDAAFNFVNFYNDLNAKYKKIYYNSSADHLLVCSFNYKRIDIFNRSLNLIKSIPTYFSPIEFDVYNDILYVATTNQIVLVIKNEVVIANITTLCYFMKSILADNYGNIAILCSSNEIYVYSVTGAYSGVLWSVNVPDSNSMSFNSNGDLVLVASNGLYIMNNQKKFINSAGVSIDSSGSIYNQSFLYSRQNFHLDKIITFYNTSRTNYTFKLITSFAYISTSYSSYLVVDNNLSRIIEFYQNFTFKTYFTTVPNPSFIISLNNSNTRELFVSSFNFGVFKLNSSNFNISAVYYNSGNGYGGLYYNQTGDYILVCSASSKRIEILRRDDLLILNYITTSPYSPTNLREYNGTLYATTLNNTILVLTNENVTSSFDLIQSCYSTTSLAIDSFGVIAVLCNPYIYLYSTNGTYLNASWTSPVENVTSIGFDGFGNFILTTYNGIYVFN